MMFLATLFGLCSSLRIPVKIPIGFWNYHLQYIPGKVRGEEVFSRKPADIFVWRTAALSVALCAQLGLQPCIAASSAPAVVLAAQSSTQSSSSPAAKVAPVPLFSKSRADLQPYVDLGRGFKLLRPFGYNEFQGAGGGYAVKFSSIAEVDENVVVGTVPASAGRESIADYGSLEDLGAKLLRNRGEGAELVSSAAREAGGVLRYDYQFSKPLDASLPRPGPRSNRPSLAVELYSLCVSRGRLWSVQATSNDRLFPRSERTLRASIASFSPSL